MKKFTNAAPFVCLLFLTLSAFSQSPAIEWQNTIGGEGYEFLYFAEQTPDGGYILGGYSISNAGADKSEASIGAEDYWVVKLDAAGEIEWENTIGGGNTDFLWALDQTADGGYILGGRSASGGGVGDKSESKIGGDDYWVVKLNSAGTVEWENTIGGLGNDLLYTVAQTEDGGYIIGGTSDSNISGDKTEARVGNNDIWVLKLNSSGAIVWQNDIGGLMNDNIYSIEETQDGGYIIGGYSESGISGDKTEANIGSTDYWVIKLNAAGTVIWDNTIGGTSSDYLYALRETMDGGYILSGVSASGIGGDKTQASKGGNDYWIMKLDISGTIIWQKTLGGSNSDLVYSNSVAQVADGGFIIGGASLSGMSGDKTEANQGSWDSWILKLDGAGNIQWQNTIGGPAGDYINAARPTQDGGYIIAGYSYSGIGGDKTEINYGDADYWVLKLEGNCQLATETCNGQDDDCDGDVDEGITVSITTAAGGPTTFCKGGSVNLTATHNGTSLQWKKNGAAIAGATTALYAATASGMYTCESSSPCGNALSSGIPVTAVKKPSASITPDGPTTFCAGGSVTLSANTGGGLSYQWYKGTMPIAGQTSSNYTATVGGKYKCRVTKNSTGCFKNSNLIVVTVPCKMENEAAKNELLIYPNPAQTYFTVDLSGMQINSSQVSISLLNILGEHIITTTAEIVGGKLVHQIALTNVPPGLYMARIKTDENIFERKVIVQ